MIFYKAKSVPTNRVLVIFRAYFRFTVTGEKRIISTNREVYRAPLLTRHASVTWEKRKKLKLHTQKLKEASCVKIIPGVALCSFHIFVYFTQRDCVTPGKKNAAYTWDLSCYRFIFFQRSRSIRKRYYFDTSLRVEKHALFPRTRKHGN